MKIGKLYQVKKCFWLIYPSKGIAVAARRDACAALDAASAVLHAANRSKHFKCNVSFIPQNSIFCLLEKDEKYCKILSINGELGWIILADWCKNYIEEVKV